MTSLSAQRSFRSSMSSKSEPRSSLGSTDCSAAPSLSLIRPPPDRCKLVLLMLFLHGIGVLMPWNIFINAKDYFQDYKLNTTTSIESDYRINFMNYVGLAAQIPNTMMSGFNVFFQPTHSDDKAGSGFFRIAVCIVIQIGVCLVTILLSFVDTSNIPETFFTLTIVSVVIINSCTGIYQSAVFGIAASLPMRYSNALVIGSNTCGTIIAVVNICSKFVSEENLQTAAVYYFSFAIAVQILCLITLPYLPHLSFYRFYQLHREWQHTQQQQPPSHLSVQAKARASAEDGVEGGGEGEEEEEQDDARPLLAGGSKVYSCRLSEDVHVQSNGTTRVKSFDTLRECCACCCFPTGKAAVICDRYWRRYLKALKACWQHCLSVWCIFFCTLSCFPAIQASIEPMDESTALIPKFWFTDVLVFLLFNLCAMVGNLTSDCVQVPGPRYLAPTVWLRAAVSIPFFLACNLFPDNRPNWFPVLIGNDAAFAIGMVVFAWSSGHLSSLCMMYAPRCVPDPRLADLAAMICAFCLVLGVVSGVAFGSFLFKVMYVR